MRTRNNTYVNTCHFLTHGSTSTLRGLLHIIILFICIFFILHTYILILQNDSEKQYSMTPRSPRKTFQRSSTRNRNSLREDTTDSQSEVKDERFPSPINEGMFIHFYMLNAYISYKLHIYLSHCFSLF